MYLNRELYGGTIPWVGSHAIDLVYWISQKKFLEVYSVQSRKANQNHNDLEASAICNFRMEDEIAASVSIDYLRPTDAPTHSDNRIRIVGSDGIVEVRDKEVFLTNSRGEQKIEFENEVNIFDEFVKKVSQKPCDTVSAKDTFYITEASIRARMSADKNQIVSFSHFFV